MKKFVIVCLIIFSIICLLTLANGCALVPTIDDVKSSENSLFTVVECNDTLFFYIVYMNDTKVMYSVSCGTSNRGNFTLLVNKDGSPMIYKEKTSK